MWDWLYVWVWMCLYDGETPVLCWWEQQDPRKF